MKNTNYSNKNVAAVLEAVKNCMTELEAVKTERYYNLDSKRFDRRGWGANETKQFKIGAVYDELSIFDWWNETLSMSQLKQMKKFLETALNLGFTGYACFKVGAAGCSHGMWAYKNETTDGYSPDGDVLHHSFRSGDNYYDMQLGDKWMSELLPGCEKGRYQFTLKEVKQVLGNVEQEKKHTLEDVLSMVSAVDEINIQEPAEEHTTGQVFSGKCSDFRATFPDVKKYLGREVNQIRACNGVVIILVA